MIRRRDFLAAVGAGPPWRPPACRGRRYATRKIAIITTVWTYQSHAQHMGDRFLVGYPRAGRWHRPADRRRLALRRPEARGRPERRSGAEHSASPSTRRIAEALRCGGDKLAVDGVLIIGEHGNYPRNDKGQILYPRFEFFRQVVDVFEKDGRAVPVFNDKHLSYSCEKAKADGRRRRSG